MQYYYSEWLENIEIKLSFVAIAGYLSLNFGGSAYLLLIVQYLFLVDFILGFYDAAKRKKMTWSGLGLGIKKIVSLYFGLIVVGFGTRAFDVAMQGRLEINYDGAFLFDVFVYLLILYELSSINRQLAEFGFCVNNFLQYFFEKVKRKIKHKIEKFFENKNY